MMKKILFLAIAGALFVSSTAMAQVGNNNCDGSCIGYHRNMTSGQHNQMMKDRGRYQKNSNYHNNRMKQSMNHRQSNKMHNGNYRGHNGNHMNHNGMRGQGRMQSNW